MTMSAIVIFKQIKRSSSAVGSGMIIIITIMTSVNAMMTSLYF